ncbi:Zinc finger BED domain-containing protein RICESLEEPER 1 [Linum grandiflorum]
MFRDIAKQLRLSPKKLGLDCKTRWNSTYDMISVALELKAVFPRYKDRDSSYQWLPSEQDWLKVKNVCEFLEMFSYVTTLISGSSYPTVNLLLPELWGIKLLLKDTLESEDGRMKAMAAKMLEKFDKYWGSCNLVIAIAAILDPRNKFKFVEVSFKDLYTDSNYHAHVQLVRDKLYALYNEYAKEYKESNEANQTEDGVGSGDAVSTTLSSVQDRKRTGRAKFDSLVRGGASSGSSDMRNELDGYLDAHLEVMDDESEFNIIDWWKKGRGKYKILLKMACEIMAIPITSVASEAAFSAGGRVIDSTRASLGQNTVEALLCSQDRLRTHYRLGPKIVWSILEAFKKPLSDLTEAF